METKNKIDTNNIISNIIKSCQALNIESYYEMKAYAYDNDKNDWIMALKNPNAKYTLSSYFKNLPKSKTNTLDNMFSTQMFLALQAEIKYDERHQTNITTY